MGKNCVREFVNSDRAWVCPRGVTSVRVMSMKDYGPQLVSGQGIGAIKANGDVYMWGSNDRGQLGTGNITNRSTPTLVLGSLKFIQLACVQVSNPGTFTMGITDAGDAYAWGDNPAGQLGDGTIVAKSSPVAVSGGIKWRSLAGGAGSSGSGPFYTTAFGVAQNGDGYAWGGGSVGQIGDGNAVNRSTPTLVSGGIKWKSICGNRTQGGVSGLAANGDYYVWGNVQASQRGDAGPSIVTSTPTLIATGYKWRAISSWSNNIYGIDESGRGFGWGGGSVGDGTSTTRSTPTLITGGLKWRYLVGGPSVSYGIDTNGVLYAWGSNSSGLIGDGTNTNRTSPTPVAGNYKWAGVSAGGQSTVGMDIFGNVYCWGVGFQGQMGDNTVVPKSTPTLVSGAQAWRNLLDTQSNSVVMDVVPGQSYDAVVFGQLVSFGGLPLAFDTSIPQNLILEYFV